MLRVFACFVGLLLCFVGDRAWAQHDSARASLPPKISIFGTGGFIWAHNASVLHLAQSHPIGMQAEYLPEGWNRTPAASFYRSYRLGLAAGVWNFRQGDKLGLALPLMFAFSNNLTGRGETALYYRLGTGIGFVTRPFSFPENRLNNAFGQTVLFSLQAGLGFRLRLSPHLALRTELGLTHFSAGAFRMPNSGINVPFAMLGLQQDLAASSRPLAPAPAAQTLPGLARSSLWVLGAGGAKQGGYEYDPFRFCGTLRVEAWQRYRHRSAWTAGADLIYNGGLIDDQRNLDLPRHTPIRIGLTAGHEWLFYNFSVTTQLGGYVYNATPQVHKPLYQRYGVRFNMNKRLSPAIFLRAHLGQADCVEWAIAYKIGQR